MVLREDVSAECLAAGEREYTRLVDRICFVWSLERCNDAVIRLQVFARGNVLDESTVDRYKFDACDKGEDADLGGSAPFPLEHGEACADDDENQDEARNDL